MAEWLGRGLQSLVRRFDPARCLHSTPASRGVFASVYTGLGGGPEGCYPGAFLAQAHTKGAADLRHVARLLA